MKIRMLAIMAGPEGSAQPGQVLDLPPERAKALIAGGYAEAVARPQPVETTEAPPAPEAAVTRRGRPGR